MNTVKQDWDHLCEVHFSEEDLQPFQREVMEWCFYHGVTSLLAKVHAMGCVEMPREETARIFNEIGVELAKFFTERKEGKTH